MWIPQFKQAKFRLMLHFGLQNLRRLQNFDTLALKPITIVVGRNSSGKSTFLRTFPLLRQSLLTSTSGPILWYGDLVDFGNYRTAVSEHDVDKNIRFIFGADGLSFDARDLFRRSRSRSGEKIEVGNLSIDYELGNRSIAAAKSLTIFRSISYIISSGREKRALNIRFSDDGSKISDVTLNGSSVQDIFPLSAFRVPKQMLSGLILAPLSPRQEAGSYFLPDPFFSMADLIYNRIKPHINKLVKDENVVLFSHRILQVAPFSRKKLESAASATGLVSIERFVERLQEDSHSDDLKFIRKICDLYYVISVIQSSVGRIRDSFNSSIYIGPVRARSDRYYRQQDLSVQDIDSDGTNLPVFLNSLNARQLDQFSSFVKDVFGFGVQIDSSEGHISIYLTYAYDRSNIVDSGFGVSQLLPILAQLWWSTSSHRSQRLRGNSLSGSKSFIVIEQPELHLHPAHQALLADIFVRTVNSADSPKPVSLIIETHSSEIINRLGALVEEGVISKDFIQIVIVEDAPESESDPSNSGAAISISNFSDSGALSNWPAGFFVPGL